MLKVTRHGLMAVDERDTFVGRALAGLGEYSWGEVEILRSFLKPDSVVVEAGAHVGAITVELARAAGRVLAFEPQRLCFQQLCANLVLNDLQNVWAVHGALGAEDGTCLVPPEGTGVRNTGGITLLGVSEGEQVVMRSIDSLGLKRVDLVKADVEGMEAHVVAGAIETIRRDRPVLYLESNGAPDGLLEALRPFGYDVFWHFPPMFVEERSGEKLLVISFNLLCLPDGVAAPSGAQLTHAREGDDGMEIANRSKKVLALA